MKENKTVQIKFRLTESQKKQVEDYATSTGRNVSEVMRLALEEFFAPKEEINFDPSTLNLKKFEGF